MNLHLFGPQQEYVFQGAYGHQTRLVLFPQRPEPAGHVVMLAFYEGQMLLTRHRQRGLEWPGGKVEPGETPLQAARRELEEETGGVAESMWLVGQYEVRPTTDPAFMKNIYVVQVDKLLCQPLASDSDDYALQPIHVEPSEDEGFSPIMCDPVFSYVKQHVLSDTK